MCQTERYSFEYFKRLALFEQTIEIDMDRVTSRAVEQNVLAMSISQSVVGLYAV